MNVMNWVHEISQSALAAAVLTLGLVILLELRSIARLRGNVERDMARMFEQLDLLRLESQQLMDGQAQLPAAAAAQMHSAVIHSQALRPQADEIYRGHGYRSDGAAADTAGHGVPAGEARLLLALQSARTRRVV